MSEGSITVYYSGALGQWQGPYLYEREIWLEDRCGLIDPERDLDGVDKLMVTALINEAPRAYQIARLAKLYHADIITIDGTGLHREVHLLPGDPTVSGLVAGAVSIRTGDMV